MSSSPQQKLTLPLIALAVSIALAGYFIGNTLYKPRIALNTAKAKGLAERRVISDQVTWSITCNAVGKSKSDIPRLYKEVEKNQILLKDKLLQEGLKKSEISLGLVNYSNREYRDKNELLIDEKHFMRGSVLVKTENVKIVNKIRAQINKLIAEGIDIDNHSPRYHFTRLNKIKPEMLKEAAKNARIAANEFAENAGVKVGKIRTAVQGGFSVIDVGNSSGDTYRLEKDVRVVITVEFYLID